MTPFLWYLAGCWLVVGMFGVLCWSAPDVPPPDPAIRDDREVELLELIPLPDGDPFWDYPEQLA